MSCLTIHKSKQTFQIRIQEWYGSSTGQVGYGFGSEEPKEPPGGCTSGGADGRTCVALRALRALRVLSRLFCMSVLACLAPSVRREREREREMSRALLRLTRRTQFRETFFPPFHTQRSEWNVMYIMMCIVQGLLFRPAKSQRGECLFLWLDRLRLSTTTTMSKVPFSALNPTRPGWLSNLAARRRVFRFGSELAILGIVSMLFFPPHDGRVCFRKATQGVIDRLTHPLLPPGYPCVVDVDKQTPLSTSRIGDGRAWLLGLAWPDPVGKLEMENG
ncbi:hypothetical protein B0T17DRAFT_514411 [Bombardia bombarda]|uniref:Uncharacterized protein n=1 Tax=Bombardia bombarda TaxID=252184 RepID=A0AA39XJ16_9PEZI|nr:hypothetical protein B0T17DRAFT_514411 [Bombardia bombarda]